MGHHLSWGHSFAGIPPQTFPDEMQGVLRAVREHCSKRNLWKFRNAYPSFSCLFDSFWPCRVGRSQDWHYFANLIHLWVAEKKRAVEIHFGNNAPNCEHVDGCRIAGELEQQFWCTIPSCADVLGVGWLASDLPGYSEIYDFDAEIRSYEDVLRF